MHDRTTDIHPRQGGAELQPARLVGGSTRASTRATTVGTRRVIERDPETREGFRRPFPRRLTVSALGAGTYLGECTEDDDEAYARTLRAAIALGINLVDTASNYRCQRSERTVGGTLDTLFESGEARGEKRRCSRRVSSRRMSSSAVATRSRRHSWHTSSRRAEPTCGSRRSMCTI